MDSQFGEEKSNPEHCGDTVSLGRRKKAGMGVSHLPAKAWPLLSWALSFWYGIQWKFVSLTEASIDTEIHNHTLSIIVKGGLISEMLVTHLRTYLRNAGYLLLHLKNYSGWCYRWGRLVWHKSSIVLKCMLPTAQNVNHYKLLFFLKNNNEIAKQ